MRIKIIDGEYAIGSCNVEDIPEWVGRFGKIEEVAFFYYHERDWIVLNEDNPNYEIYKIIVQGYLELSNEGKKEFAESAIGIKRECADACRVLNYVLRIRRKLYASMKRKAGAAV